jgi:hypothetical protein
MPPTIPQQQLPPSRAWHPTWQDLDTELLDGDAVHTELERRIIALEEALVSRRARRRLRRRLRAVAKAYAWAGSFESARWESALYEQLAKKYFRRPPMPPIPDEPADGER